MTVQAVAWRPPQGPDDPAMAKVSALLDYVVQHPEFAGIPTDADGQRRMAAAALANPNVAKWEVWDDDRFCGLLLLHDVVPLHTATFDLCLVDGNLVGKRTLLQNFLRMCFTDLGFQRIGMQIPEGFRLERFARSVLGFRYEGERRARSPELPAALNMTWVAKQGARRERAHWGGQRWRDLMLLRLLADEYETSPA